MIKTMPLPNEQRKKLKTEETEGRKNNKEQNLSMTLIAYLNFSQENAKCDCSKATEDP